MITDLPAANDLGAGAQLDFVHRAFLGNFRLP
jgi:hypothetical protein